MASYSYTFQSGDTLTPTKLNDARTVSDIVNADIKSDANIAGTKLADAAITTAKIADANVTTAKIADANVTAAKLASSAVETAKITDANVTTAKIADANVTTAKIADANVTAAKLASNAVETAKIADATSTTTGVTNSKLRHSAALSVIGRTSNTDGAPADIAAATDGHVLRRSGTFIGFGTLAAGAIADASITAAKLDGVAKNSSGTNLSVGTAPAFGCRAWVTFATNGTITAAGNVSSVSKTDEGEYTITFATAMPDANYVMIGSAFRASDSEKYVVSLRSGLSLASARSSSSCNIDAYLSSGNQPSGGVGDNEPTEISVAFFR
jgi:hypothetical protein